MVCAGLSELDERIAAYELKTSLSDSFVGLAYTYDDNGQSEGWMKTVLSESDDSNKQRRAAMALSSDEGVIKAQVAASMETLLMAVQDRVMTEAGVLEQPELRSANWQYDSADHVNDLPAVKNENSRDAEIVEQPVWGMDCYTRRNIAICLEAEFDTDTVHSFIEKWLLPAINACPVDLAYNLSNAALILEGLPFDTSSSLDQDSGTTTADWSATLLGRALVRKIKESSPPWLKAAANILRRAITSLGHDFFRVHPKGHGSIVLCPKIAPNRLVTYYRGEVYPSWRWGEKMDAISVIQQKKGLKPRLPDFYNMALERPQTDPRGYGLLFVDASRKSGYGSMLSHSCNPSCEVKVVALNGKLNLAMTTLREMTIGEEITFDYNAATDSLHEYQAAICLCGNVHCRGSFLHFAMADCYQQVLNRNSPIAVLLSQLIKGCTKQVMADDDDKVLKRHGFQSAVFGAVSVNRRRVSSAEDTHAPLDSMEFVPIWLRTFVADTLRYIEYERRALPIALLCNEITKVNEIEKKKSESEACPAAKSTLKKTVDQKSLSTSSKKIAQPLKKTVDTKPVKGHKPEPTFFFFAKCRREYLQSKLVQTQDTSNLTGLALESELKKIASAEWKILTPQEKEEWKLRAYDAWKENGGEKKARLETERLVRVYKAGKAVTSEPLETTADRKVKSKVSDQDADGETERITFQAADAEGIRAMEQRIQQLTQSLSRVGRVLDRHREVKLRLQQSSVEQIYTPASLRSLAHSPLSIMPDEHVIAWMWSHEDGIVRTLLRMAKEEICVSPDLNMALQLTETKFSALSMYGTPWKHKHDGSDFPMSPPEGRKVLNSALMEFRLKLLEGIDKMAADIKQKKTSMRETEKRKKQQAKKFAGINTPCDQAKIRLAVKFLLNEMVDAVEEKTVSKDSRDPNVKSAVENSEITEPWLLNYNKRFKIEKAADILLLYIRTSTFFRLVPYEALKSSPIEVYARELGNEVPISIVDHDQELVTSWKSKSDLQSDASDKASSMDDTSSSSILFSQGDRAKIGRVQSSSICDPEDIISEVVVGYQGDYVLSQLLQWYNAGLEQKSGLPDMLGCCTLPSMVGCWSIDATKVTNSSTDKSTSYRQKMRPRLVEWLKDPYKRGSPWPDELRKHFVEKEEEVDAKNSSLAWLPIGSPVLDLLVTGDDFNMMAVLNVLGSDSSGTDDSNEGLMSTVDHGRPAQAVSNWVQCENPSCQKWRKIPWHVDIDMLSEKFVCSDNMWNEVSASCDAPEDVWDEENDACVEADGSVKPREVDRSRQDSTGLPTTCACKLTDFRLKGKLQTTTRPCLHLGTGLILDLLPARFDVLRTDKKNKKWRAAKVADLDFVGVTKRVKFHFPRTDVTNDVWLDATSSRIAPLYTHTHRPQPRQRKQSSSLIRSNEKPSNVKEGEKKAASDDSSFDSSFALAASELASDALDDENDYEEVGVGAVEDYEQIGDADTEESEDEEIDLVDDDDDKKSLSGESEDDVDGLNDDIEDESEDSDAEMNDEKNERNVNEHLIATVTDHSSPDGSPKRDRDSSLEKVHVSSESTNSRTEGESSQRIPKKKKILVKPEGSSRADQSRIPKKKKIETAKKPILAALDTQSCSKSDFQAHALEKSKFSRENLSTSNSVKPTSSPATQQSCSYDRSRALELARDWEQWKRRSQQPALQSPSSRGERPPRNDRMSRNVELRLNRDSLNEKRFEQSKMEYNDGLSPCLGGRNVRPDHMSRSHEPDLGSPRRISLSNQGHNKSIPNYDRRAISNDLQPGDNPIRPSSRDSHMDSYHPDEQYSIYSDSRYVDRFSDRHLRESKPSPSKRFREHDQGLRGYQEDERCSRWENPRHQSFSTERSYNDEDHTPNYGSHGGNTDTPPNDGRRLTNYRSNDCADHDRHAASQRGYDEAERQLSPAKRGYDVEPKASPAKRGYEIESPPKRGYEIDESPSPRKRRRDEESPRRIRYGSRSDDGYQHRHDDRYRSPSKFDDDYRSHQRNDGMQRDDYSRRDYDDHRTSNYDRRRDDHRHDSPRSSRRRDHLGRDEYANRAQEHAQRSDRYRDDGYRR